MSEARKIGTGHASAMLRLGLKELRNAVNPSRDSVADSEIGLYGTQTQGEIAQARGGAGAGPEQEGQLTVADLRSAAQEQPGQEQSGQERPGQERANQAHAGKEQARQREQGLER